MFEKFRRRAGGEGTPGRGAENFCREVSDCVSLSALTTLTPNVRGAVAPFLGQGTYTVNVRTSQNATPVAASNATVDQRLAGRSRPNHFRVSEFIKRGGRYFADTIYEWRINRPDGSDLGYCQSHVEILGPSGAEVARYDQTGFDQCRGGGTWGTNTQTFDAGTYTVNLEVLMIGDADVDLPYTQGFLVDRRTQSGGSPPGNPPLEAGSNPQPATARLADVTSWSTARPSPTYRAPR